MAAEIIDRVRELLDPRRLVERIDDPADRAVMDFRVDSDTAYSHARFQNAIAEFVRHVYGNAFPCGRVLSQPQAHDEAVALLEQAYPSASGDGYDDAILDAADPNQAGVDFVLSTMAEAIKERQRSTHVRWVRARYVDSADWPTRCAVAELLLEDWRSWLPPDWQDCSPGDLAGVVWHFLTFALGVDDQGRPLETDPSRP